MNRWSCIHLYMFFISVFILAMGAFPVFTQLSVCLYRVAVFSFFLFLSSLVVFLTSSPPSLRRCRYTMKCLRQLTKMQSEGKRRTSIKRVTHRCRSHLFFLFTCICVYLCDFCFLKRSVYLLHRHTSTKKEKGRNNRHTKLGGGCTMQIKEARAFFFFLSLSGAHCVAWRNEKVARITHTHTHTQCLLLFSLHAE